VQSNDSTVIARDRPSEGQPIDPADGAFVHQASEHLVRLFEVLAAHSTAGQRRERRVEGGVVRDVQQFNSGPESGRSDTMRTVNPSPSGAVTSEPKTASAKPRKYGALLWTVQGMLAVVFLFAGSMKLVMPAEELAKQMSLSVSFLRFIGVCEVLGALGLILPGLSRIRTDLTSLAAAGLVVIMIGAMVVTVATTSVAPALMPMVVGCLAAFVAYGRSRLVPMQGRNLRNVFASRRASRGLNGEAL
jgi:hypothetical protein